MEKRRERRPSENSTNGPCLTESKKPITRSWRTIARHVVDMSARHALTFDLEDWHQHGWRHVCGEWRPPSEAVRRDTYRILDLLDELNVRATFFVVGLLAEGCPELVRDVARRGHEIGTHSHAHHLVHRLDREKFRRDVERSKKYLEDLTGTAVLGFRAPEFSIRALDH